MSAQAKGITNSIDADLLNGELAKNAPDFWRFHAFIEYARIYSPYLILYILHARVLDIMFIVIMHSYAVAAWRLRPFWTFDNVEF